MFEIIIYLVFVVLLTSVRRVISGMKNGAFYGRNTKPLPPKLAKYIKNIHFLETPAWYTQFGSLFFAVFAIFRLIHFNTGIEFDFWQGLLCFIIQLTATLVVCMGSSGMANFHFQGYINHGSSLPWVDPNENPLSEFAFGPISFWWKRPWYGKRRKYIILLGFLSVILGIWMGVKSTALTLLF